MNRRNLSRSDKSAERPLDVDNCAGTISVLDGLLLLLERNDSGLLTFAKGHIEPGEYLAQTAVRETREETGVEVEIARWLGTLHRYTLDANGKPVHKRTALFLGNVVDLNANKRPDQQPTWVTPEEALARVSPEEHEFLAEKMGKIMLGNMAQQPTDGIAS